MSTPSRRLARILLACAIAASAPGLAQVFKWTDANGKTHYGDSPPADALTKEVAITVPSYDGPVEVRDWSAILKRKSAGAVPERHAGSAVTMYMTSWCPHCKRARAYFTQRHIAFTELDVEKSEAGRKGYESLGGGGVPIILVGDKVMRGFSPNAFEALR